MSVEVFRTSSRRQAVYTAARSDFVANGGNKAQWLLKTPVQRKQYIDKWIEKNGVEQFSHLPTTGYRRTLTDAARTEFTKNGGGRSEWYALAPTERKRYTDAHEAATSTIDAPVPITVKLKPEPKPRVKKARTSFEFITQKDTPSRPRAAKKKPKGDERDAQTLAWQALKNAQKRVKSETADQTRTKRAKKDRWSLTDEEMTMICRRSGGFCECSGIEFSTKVVEYDSSGNPHYPLNASVDQTIAGAGYDVTNARLVCNWYNISKNTWSQELHDKLLIDYVKAITKKRKKPTKHHDPRQLSLLDLRPTGMMQ